MKLAVTGATGYIGAHFVKRAAEVGHKVVVTDKNWSQNNVNWYSSAQYAWDITEEAPFKPVEVDKVLHLAALTKVTPSVTDPWAYNQTNVVGTKNVIGAFPCDHFIYCSTGAAFQPGSSPYATTKYMGELVTKQFNDKASIVRFYNVSGNDGMHKFDDEVYHLIRRAARVANGYYNRMDIHGTDYDTRDGTAIRNYTHVADIVDGLMRIVENEPSGEVDCLGSQEGYTVREVIDTMKEVSGKNFPVFEGSRRPGDIETSTVPYESPFFVQKRSLADQCRDALLHEKE